MKTLLRTFGFSARSAPGPLLLIGVGLAVLNISSQIAYPLASGGTQHLLTIVSVLLFFASSLTHCVATRSFRSGLALVVVCVGGGLAAEAVGWRTGWPFGNYRYGTTLGPKFLGVPVVVPLAWAMMGWPALVAGRFASRRGAKMQAMQRSEATAADGGPTALTTSGSRIATAVTGSLVLTSWDLFLDPQMVDAGHWYWLPTSGPWLNGIPLMNSLGWFCVGVLMIAILDWLVAESPRVPNADLLIWVLLGWVWFSEIFGHLVFFGRPCVALIGGLATTLVGVIVFRTGLRRRNNVDQVSNACRLNNVGPVNNDDRVNIVGNGEQADRVR